MVEEKNITEDFEWLPTRGTNTFHAVKGAVIKDHKVTGGKSICGSGTKFEERNLDVPLPEDKKCKKCVHKLELLNRGKEQ